MSRSGSEAFPNSNQLANKKLIVGVTGGIAAYKAVDLVSKLKKLDADVVVVMTPNAAKFVSPLTFHTISKNKVHLNVFEDAESWQPDHLAVADQADLMIIAPATANTIAKLACGLADDVLSTLALALRAPVLVAPAMNHYMYENIAVQQNIKTLKSRGFNFIGPEYGMLAEGYEGVGRMSEPQDILNRALEILNLAQDLKSLKFLITAGPTREPIDPIRFISNRSSGKMGYALASAAKSRGAKVTLISGPVSLEIPPNLEFERVETTAQMRESVLKHVPSSDVIIMAAAVSDFRASKVATSKIKKIEHKDTLDISLEKNPDILAEVGKIKTNRQIVIGFAAETEELIQNAKKKLTGKNLDLIVANDVLKEGAGFESDTNIVTIISKDGKVKNLPLMSKLEVAHAVLDEVKRLIRL
jgi:phosphopantothenoylcysteine decarboxylase/phosphopantothenate--cysteine ligase